MVIDYDIDTIDGIVTFYFSSQPEIEDYQQSFLAALREIEAAGISRWLLVLDYEPRANKDSSSYNEFVAREVSRYVTKLAVVCPLQGHARMRNVLEPIINQHRQVAMFQMQDEARSWLCE